MKFNEFLLTEAPYINDDVKNNPEFAGKMFQKHHKSKPSKEWDWNGYNVFEYKGNYGTTDLFLKKDTIVELYIAYSVEDYKNLGKMYRNTYIQKGIGDISKQEIIDFLFVLAKKTNADGLISDDIQSTGGKKMWRNILEHGSKTGKEVGVYENQKHAVQPMEADKKFALWYAIKSREIYSDKELLKANFQVYIKM